MGVVPLYLRPQRALSSFYHVRTQQEDAIYEPENGPSPDPESAGALILAFQPPDL